MQKIISLLFLCFLSRLVSSQSLTTIPLPESCSVSHFSDDDSIVVITTGWSHMYYRYKHDTVWTQITAPFTFYRHVSVYNNSIYVMATTENDTSMSGLLVSSNLGQTWTQKCTQDFLMIHNVAYPSLFASDANSFSGWYGSVLKNCNYFTGVINDITPSFGLIPPHKLQYWNGTLYYYGYNHTSGSVIGGDVAYQITSTVWGYRDAPSNGLQMVATDRGDDLLYVDRGSGLFYTSLTGAYPFNQWQFNIGSDFNSSFQVICGYDKFYVLRDKTIYYSSDGISWSSFYNTAIPNLTFLEVLPNGNLLLTCGPMLEYDPVAHTFKSFNHGINEAGVESASINSSNDVFMIADNMKYYKSNIQNEWKMLFDVNDYVNPHVSNSGILYLNGYGTLMSSSDSGNTFTSMGWLDYYAMHYKNDSVLMLNSYSTKISNNGGQTFNPAATPAFTDSVSYIGTAASNFNRDQLAIIAYYLSSFSQLFYTTDFGNSWVTSDTILFNSNSYGTGFAIDNDLYYINVNNFATDTVYKILPASHQVMTTFANSTNDSIIEKNFWVDDSHLYLQQIIQHGTQYYFQVYRSISLTGTFVQLFSVLVDGAVGFSTGKFANCGAKKLFWKAQNKLFLFEDNTALSVSENESMNELLVYPNPASDKINFVSNTKIKSLKLFNALGGEVYCNEFNSDQYTIDISNLPAGIYLYKMTDVQGFEKTDKIIKN